MSEAAPREWVYISVASNIHPEAHIPKALALLAAQVELRGISTFYRTLPIGRPEQPSYLNGVVRMHTSLAPRQLKEACLRPIEAQLGRQRNADAYAARTMDLDLLLYGNRSIEEQGLVVPDPDILRRPFLAAGILDLDPDILLPQDGQRLADAIRPTDLDALSPETPFTLQIQERFLHE